MHKSVKPIHNCSKHLRVFCTHASSYTFYNSCAHIPQPEVERRGKIFRRDPISSSNLSIYIYIYPWTRPPISPTHNIFIHAYVYKCVYIYIYNIQIYVYGIHGDIANLYDSLDASNFFEPQCRLPQFKLSHRTFRLRRKCKPAA